jgi:hypothetical protein
MQHAEGHLAFFERFKNSDQNYCEARYSGFQN